MSEEPKPCPFCGAKAEMITAMNEAWVACHSCGASGPMRSCGEMATTAWNTRIESSEIAALKEALRIERNVNDKLVHDHHVMLGRIEKLLEHQDVLKKDLETARAELHAVYLIGKHDALDQIKSQGTAP